MKQLLFLSLLLAGVLPVSAQETVVADPEIIQSPLFLPAVSAHLGTQGVGFALNYPILNRFNFRLGGSFLPVKYSSQGTFGGKNTRIEMNARLNNFHGIADVQLFPKSKSLFRKMIFSAGGGYFYRTQSDFQLQPTEDFHYNEIVFKESEIGMLKVNVNWEGFAPYAGFGFNNIKLSNFLNMNVAIGTYQLQSPAVMLSGTKMISSKPADEAQLEQNLRSYRWLPVLQLGFNYNLTFNKSKDEK